MTGVDRSSHLMRAWFIVVLFALSPGRSALADEWTKISAEEARISFDAASLTGAYSRHARSTVGLGMAELGTWAVLPEGFPRAQVYAEILHTRVHFTSRLDLKEGTKSWTLLKDKTLEFGDRNSYWNSLGQGSYRSFVFEDHECVAFQQYWGQTEETRGVDAGTRMLFGYYCNPAGDPLSEETIDSLLDSLRVRTSG
jgi:hypothetical protein